MAIKPLLAIKQSISVYCWLVCSNSKLRKKVNIWIDYCYSKELYMLTYILLYINSWNGNRHIKKMRSLLEKKILMPWSTYILLYTLVKLQREAHWNKAAGETNRNWACQMSENIINLWNEKTLLLHKQDLPSVQRCHFSLFELLYIFLNHDRICIHM